MSFLESVLDNGAINRANLHSAVQALAQGAGGLFVFVFLLRSGVSAPLVLCTIAAMTLGRFVLRMGVLPLARRIGLRNALMLGTVLEAAIFPLLPHVRGPGPMLVLVIAVSAVGSVIYWTSYHAFFASMGDAEGRGGQTGAREALNALVGIGAPLLGGWGMAGAGPAATFYAAALVQMLAAVPLIGAPNPRPAHEAPGGFAAAAFAARLQALDGWFGAIFAYVWQIALFVTLGEHYGAFGGAMAIAGVLSAAGSVALGRLVDRGAVHGPVLLAYGLATGAVLLRASAYGAPWLAIGANALGAFIGPLMSTVMMTRVYNLAKASPCPLRFHMGTEAGWDLGCAGCCLASAALLAAGASFAAPLLLAAPAALAMGALLRESYAGA